MLFIMAEAVRRLFYPQTVSGAAMMAVALAASLGNLFVALALRKSVDQNINIKTAYLHNLGDAVISLSPVAGGILIATTGWTTADPVIGLLVGAAVLSGTWTVFRESLRVLLDLVPNGIEAEKVAEAVLAMPGVRNVHDLHIWSAGANLRFWNASVNQSITADPISMPRLSTMSAYFVLTGSLCSKRFSPPSLKLS